MPELHSISEASRLYRLSEKTLRNWIRDGLLTPQKKRVNGKLQYALDSAQLEEVMHERNMIAVPIRSTGEQSRMDVLEQRLDDVLLRLSDAEDAIQALHRRLTIMEASPSAMSLPAPSTPLVEASSEMMQVDEFKLLHNLHISQVRAVVGSATHLTKAELHAIWQAHHTKTRFRECDACPHE